MNRLILGDVGCGKTVVAAMPILAFAKPGFQCAFMAPTEILAKQHYQTIKELFINTDIKIELLTGSLTPSQKEKISQGIKSGKIDLIIGTHALFQDMIDFKNLSYIIIDEQHRFGVKQRIELMKKGNNPDVLYLSATPIPRTLALTLYGDLDISIIKDKPAKRIPVKTSIVKEKELKKIFSFIEKQALKGNQAYIVYPLIEDSDKIALKAAATEYDKIKNTYLKNIECGLIHGRMNPKERESVMNDFITGNISVLFSTTVIEVGVDVTGATIMLIENSHRYGLSTLHQLRGRVGRGDKQSYCFLVVPDNAGETARLRAGVMKDTNDGFVIAQKDLEMRGPGEFLGTKQHGILPFRLASLTRDKELFFMAMSDVELIFNSDPDFKKPEHNALKKSLYKNFNSKYFSYLGN